MLDVLLSPALVLSTLVASGYSFAFHFVWGNTFRQLVRFWLVGLAGFALGHLAATAAGWNLLAVGDVHLAEGTLACWLALFLAKAARI